jgi:Putative Actinobacterial Holin-X, holin superfamily III
MATNSDLRENSIADLLSELSQESVELLRQELRLVVTDIAAEGRQVGTGVGLLGGAAALGVGAFGALTAGLIAALGRRPSRGALLVATLYGAGAAGLADAGVRRLGRVAPQVLETIQRDVKATAKGASRSAGSSRASGDSATKAAPRKPAAKGPRPKPAAKGARPKPAASATEAG